METQRYPWGEVVLRPKLSRFLLGLLAIFLAEPASGDPAEIEPEREHRKALRAYPVAHRAGVDRPTSHRAIPVDEYRAIPRATVVRRKPVEVEPFLEPQEREPAQKPQPKPPTKLQRPSNSPSAASLVRRCDLMALKGLAYRFGGDDPSGGGLDCSGAVQYLLRQEGMRNVPRTAYTQYQWLKGIGNLHRVRRWSRSASRVTSKLRPGDLLFWTGTYKTGKSPNISHVMIYLGRDANNGKHYMFGASSRRSKGVHGHAVDVYEFVYPRRHGKDNFAGFGTVPGLARN